MRVVSLVPSATETLLALGVTPVACTRFCEQPELPHVGGTKNPDVAAIVALAPDLVVVNDEENRREDADALEAAGLSVHSMSPRSVDDVGPAVVALAERVGVAAPAGFAPAAWSELLAAERGRVTTRRSCVVFVWRRPWMTLAADTYGASLLDALGLDHIPIGSAAPGDAGRYPETTLEDVAALEPALALLPSEPYAFKDRHREEVQAALPGARVVLVDGQDLFWWGSRTPAALARLRGAIS
jgi:ABC-type Fe3+-hydroxamate transport system substrate-binding protein